MTRDLRSDLSMQLSSQGRNIGNSKGLPYQINVHKPIYWVNVSQMNTCYIGLFLTKRNLQGFSYPECIFVNIRSSSSTTDLTTKRQPKSNKFIWSRSEGTNSPRISNPIHREGSIGNIDMPGQIYSVNSSPWS